MRFRLLGRLAVVSVVAATTLLSPARPARAVSQAALVLDGTVTYSPGLSSAPTAQTVQFQGTGVLAVVRHGRLSPITVSCSFSGTSVGAEDIAQGAGSGGGGCSRTDGEPVSLSCVTTYQRARTTLTLTGWCWAGMADGTESPRLAGTLTFDPGTSQPITSAPGRAVLDLATVESVQYAVGSGYIGAWSTTTWLQGWTTLVGPFVSGGITEVGQVGCAIYGSGPWLLVEEVAQGTMTVSCSGTGLTGVAVAKQCTMPFILGGGTLTMTGQCVLWVGGVGAQAFESHSYALVLSPAWGSTSPRYQFTATGTHQAVAP